MGAGIGFMFALIISLGVNTIGWAISALAETDKCFDGFGAATFLLLSLYSWAWAGPVRGARILLAIAMLAIWAARLGFFLVTRIIRAGHDRRLQVYLKDPIMFLAPWGGQTLWAVLSSLPVIVLATAGDAEAQGGPISVGWDYGALALWAAGFAVQVVADHQKRAWASNPRNRGRFINTGLWALSRHPNYVGQICLAWALSAFCLPGNIKAVGWLWALLVSLAPAFETWLLLAVSGIPLLERQGRDKWGDDPRYRAYVAATPVLIPGLPSSWLPGSGGQSGKRRA